MAQTLIDLSLPIESGLPSDPEMMIPKIDFMDHTAGAASMKKFFPGLSQKDLPGGLGWAVEFVRLTTHSGNHLDAPYHYHPTMDGGKKALTIDEVPLEWCFQNGVLLDFAYKADGERITAADVETELERGYCHMEKLAHLDALPRPTGFKVACFPVNIKAASAGWTRPVAIFDTDTADN